MRHVSLRLTQLVAQVQALASAGDLAGATALLADALSQLAQHPRRASAESAEATAVKARVLVSRGEADAALVWAGSAQAAQQSLYGSSDERTLAAAAIHAAALHRTGSHTRAAQLYHEILDQVTVTDGPQSRRALAANADLATAEHAGGCCLAARRRLAEAWQRHRTLYGDAAPAGIKMLARLGAMERDCGEVESSRRHLALADELCAGHLSAGHPLTAQVTALLQAPRSTSHVCRPVDAASDRRPPVAPDGVLTGPWAVGTTPGATRVAPGVVQAAVAPSPVPVPHQRSPAVAGVGFLDWRSAPAASALEPHTPRPRSQRAVLVAVTATVGLLAVGATVAATLARGGKPPPASTSEARASDAPSPDAPPADAPPTAASPPGAQPTGTSPPGTQPTGAPLPGAQPTSAAHSGSQIPGISPTGAESPVAAPAGAQRPGSPPVGAPAPDLPSSAGQRAGVPPSVGQRTAGVPSKPDATTSFKGTGRSAVATPPSGVILEEKSNHVTLRWKYPVATEGPVLISGGRLGQQRRAFQQLPAGSTSYAVYGLNQRLDYCFTVSVVRSGEDIATSKPVCTPHN